MPWLVLAVGLTLLNCQRDTPTKPLTEQTNAIASANSASTVSSSSMSFTYSGSPLLPLVTGLPAAYKPLTPYWESYHPAGAIGPKQTAIRIYSDGLVFKWSDERRLADGSYASAGNAWRKDRKLTVAGIAATKKLIREWMPRLGWFSVGPRTPISKLQSNLNGKTLTKFMHTAVATPEANEFHQNLGKMLNEHTEPQGVPTEQPQ